MTKWTVVRVWREVEADTALEAIMRTRSNIHFYDEVRCAERIRLLTDDDDPVTLRVEDEDLLFVRRPPGG